MAHSNSPIPCHRTIGMDSLLSQLEDEMNTAKRIKNTDNIFSYSKNLTLWIWWTCTLHVIRFSSQAYFLAGKLGSNS